MKHVLWYVETELRGIYIENAGKPNQLGHCT
jgi:hypothetical protein